MADDGKEPKDDPFADDDDDDDEEAPAEGEEEGSKKGVPMVGDVTLQDGRLFWAGLWADSEADLAAGKGKKFKYGGPEGQTAAALTQMPSGEWHGYFFNPGDEGDTKCKEKGVKLKFDGNQRARRREPVRRIFSEGFLRRRHEEDDAAQGVPLPGRR